MPEPIWETWNLTRTITDCSHSNIDCLNHFELIRKYRCNTCGAVMMCDCDEAIGRRFLAHQLDSGTELETRQRVPVTLGFQPKICTECKGLPPVTAPVAAIHGRTSKIKRYYWREIAFQKMELFGDWVDQGGSETGAESVRKRNQFEREVVDEIRRLHATAPKYLFQEESQSEVIRKYQVKVLRLEGEHVRCEGSKRIAIQDGSKRLTPEEFASQYFANGGWNSVFLESAPFHVLFGVFTWLLI
jgi:hypothetical protein